MGGTGLVWNKLIGSYWQESHFDPFESTFCKANFSRFNLSLPQVIYLAQKEHKLRHGELPSSSLNFNSKIILRANVKCFFNSLTAPWRYKTESISLHRVKPRHL